MTSRRTSSLIFCLLALVLFSTSASAFDWCSFAHIGCPPPAQSIATTPDANGLSVPIAVSPNQQGLASYDQAAQLKAFINAKFAAQIIAGDDSANPGHVAPDGTFGIYVPLFTGPGISAPSTTVKGVRYYYVHFRFDNGADFNVGLAIQKFQNFPSNPDYVVGQLVIDAKTMVVGSVGMRWTGGGLGGFDDADAQPIFTYHQIEVEDEPSTGFDHVADKFTERRWI